MQCRSASGQWQALGTSGRPGIDEQLRLGVRVIDRLVSDPDGAAFALPQRFQPEGGPLAAPRGPVVVMAPDTDDPSASTTLASGEELTAAGDQVGSPQGFDGSPVGRRGTTTADTGGLGARHVACGHGGRDGGSSVRGGPMTADPPERGWGWAGTIEQFLGAPDQRWLDDLSAHHAGLMGTRPAGSQVTAWRDEHGVVATALRAVCVAEPTATGWGVVFEYELPLEGGRRPDVVVLAGGTVVVIELKTAAEATPASADQVEAYARDLAEYHEASHGRPIKAVLVPTRATVPAALDEVSVADPVSLAGVLLDAATPGTIPLDAWLLAPYAPLPTLVAAARRIFQHEPLPHVKRALSAGIPEAVELLGHLAEQAADEGQRLLVFVAGVPGSGKTLAGLRLVYERSTRFGSAATFLSGNGPLVQVLQDALKSRAFVRDLHAFIKTYGIGGRLPKEHVIVFDEAQRAWDKAYMHHKRGVPHSEPELLIGIGEHLERWATLVGLVGDGQEIHSGEEAGMAQWADAARPPSATATWHVHCPPRLRDEFAGLPVHTHDHLDLTVSLRSRRAEHLHDWVAHLLRGSLALAARLAQRVQTEAFPLYLTRDLDEAEHYVRARYAGEPDRRYGLLASSQAKILTRYGVDNGWMATSRMNIAAWFNAPADDPASCCALTKVATEFGCQGLELDLPIVCWGEDVTWTGTAWVYRPVRRRYRQDDPVRILENVYRVLLTRGRDGLVVFLPDAGELDLTEHALLAAGVQPMPAELPLAAEA